MSAAEPDRGYILDDLKRMIVRVGANERWYDQSWLGVTVWQLPEDLIRLQRAVFEVRPQWIVETGTKFGGSAIFFASLLSLVGRTDGGVITVDVDGKDEARQAFATHAYGHLVKDYIVGDAAAETTAERVRSSLGRPVGPVLVFLDDNHNAAHVTRELALYASLVSVGSYLIVADTVFEDLAGTPAGRPSDKYPDVSRSNPRTALRDFLKVDGRFEPDPRFAAGGPGNFCDGFLMRLR